MKTEMRMLRWMSNNTFKRYDYNEGIHEKLKVMKKTRENQLIWFGHV